MVGRASWRAGGSGKEVLDPEPDADPSGAAAVDGVDTSFFLDDGEKSLVPLPAPLLRRRERAAAAAIDFEFCILEAVAEE